MALCLAWGSAIRSTGAVKLYQIIKPHFHVAAVALGFELGLDGGKVFERGIPVRNLQPFRQDHAQRLGDVGEVRLAVSSQLADSAQNGRIANVLAQPFQRAPVAVVGDDHAQISTFGLLAYGAGVRGGCYRPSPVC